MVRMWDWSRNSECGRETEAEAMFGAAGGHGQGRPQGGVLGAAGAAGELEGELGLELQRGAAAYLEALA
jgi:hypothetical protein